MHGHNPTDSRGPTQWQQRPREAKILDLTPRLPAREGTPQLEPPPRSARRPMLLGLLVCGCVVLGMVIGAAAAHRFRQGAARAAALELMSDLEQPVVLAVRWTAQENRSLRLMGLLDQRRAGGRDPVPMTLDRERLAELWLLEAVEKRPDPLALRALATYHLKHPDEQHFLLLARSELETYLARFEANSSVLNDLAVVLALLDRLPEAMQTLEQALAREGREPVLLYNAAQVARALGPRSLEAEKDYLLRYLEQDQGSRWRAAMELRLRDISDFRTRLVDGFSNPPSAIKR